MRVGIFGRAGGTGVRRIAILLLGLSLLVAAAGCSRDTARYPEVRARDGYVAVDLSGIGAGSGRFSSFRSRSGRTVDFLAYRDSSGTPHAVLDACRTCYRWKKGYVLEGAEVVCVKCDMRFKIDALAAGTGSCIPIPLKSVPEGDALHLPVAELEAGAKYF